MLNAATGPTPRRPPARGYTDSSTHGEGGQSLIGRAVRTGKGGLAVPRTRIRPGLPATVPTSPPCPPLRWLRSFLEKLRGGEGERILGEAGGPSAPSLSRKPLPPRSLGQHDGGFFKQGEGRGGGPRNAMGGGGAAPFSLNRKPRRCRNGKLVEELPEEIGRVPRHQQTLRFAQGDTNGEGISRGSNYEAAASVRRRPSSRTARPSASSSSVMIRGGTIRTMFEWM